VKLGDLFLRTFIVHLVSRISLETQAVTKTFPLFVKPSLTAFAFESEHRKSERKEKSYVVSPDILWYFVNRNWDYTVTSPHEVDFSIQQITLCLLQSYFASMSCHSCFYTSSRCR